MTPVGDGAKLRPMGKVDLSIDAALAAQAQAAGLEPEAIAEAAIRAALQRASDRQGADRARVWAEENVTAIEAHRAQIEAHGVFGQDLRTW